jgi:hypothetical protein
MPLKKTGQEEKHHHDQEIAFKVTARRNKLLGHWAATKMGITGEAAEAYAKAVVASDFEKPGDADVVEKVLGDFKAKDVAVTEPQLRQEMNRLMGEAKQQIVGA